MGGHFHTLVVQAKHEGETAGRAPPLLVKVLWGWGWGWDLERFICICHLLTYIHVFGTFIELGESSDGI